MVHSADVLARLVSRVIKGEIEARSTGLPSDFAGLPMTPEGVFEQLISVEAVQALIYSRDFGRIVCATCHRRATAGDASTVPRPTVFAEKAELVFFKHRPDHLDAAGRRALAADCLRELRAEQ